ncbi:unnamed protein product [Effrenium voratum]|nr:unnamed protein product [Effrenium voratum]
MGRSPPPFFPGAGRTPAREMRRFARPGRGRHDLGGLCGHGAGTSRGRESSGEDLTARSTALTRPAWSANSADAKTASAQFCWRCGELIRQGRLPLTEADGKTERTLETAITVPPDTRLSRPSRKRGLAALGAFSLCSWPSQAMTQSKVDSDVTHTFLNAWDADIASGPWICDAAH